MAAWFRRSLLSWFLLPSPVSNNPTVLQPTNHDSSHAASAPNQLGLPGLFACTLFLSALLLFLVQPMIAKMLLPLFGGTPAVWNTCMVFFQAMLLAGYAYAHFVTTRLKTKPQILLHLGVLLAGGLGLPLSIPESFANSQAIQEGPSLWLLRCLTLAAGLPFFVAATTGPLVQKWFSRTGHRSSADPYFLYAASNLGSLIALLAYPLLFEPFLRLNQQSLVWAIGFGIFAILTLICALTQWRVNPSTLFEIATPQQNAGIAVTSPNIRRRIRWIVLAFVPSSLMLGVTTYLTTDIASIPLLWILPLSLYLLTFVLAFARRTIFPLRWLERALPLATIALIYLLVTEATDPIWMLIPIHLAVFFIASLGCHTRLALERPSATYLTEFYLWISVGGVLGGFFNALIAPAVFTRVTEYPLTIMLACVLNPRLHSIEHPAKPFAGWRQIGYDLAFPIGIAVLTIFAALITSFWELPSPLRLLVVFGIPLILSYAAVDRPGRFVLALAAVMLSGSLYSSAHGRTVHADRNFFGVLRVTRDAQGRFRRLVHGNTVHGRQFIDAARQGEPLSYYHRTGPLGQIFQAFNARPAATNVAVIGLGAGSMAAYATPRQRWSYYEINPAVIRIASDTNFFSFLAKSSAASMEMIAGDARLRLREAPTGHYDLIVLDAFSSDSIPVHLITREALDLYLAKLANGGLLAFHISNRCLELEPIVGDLAANAGLTCVAFDDMNVSAEDVANGKDQSHWVMMARAKEDLGKLVRDSRWLPVKSRPIPEVWSDDFSNILSVLKWN
jgi:spermidine synthase